MTAVDTNIIVRLLTRDDEKQFQKAMSVFMKDDTVFIPDTVILETEWVLRYAYQFEPAEIRNAFTKLLGLPNVRVAEPYLVAKAIDWHRQGLDFADGLHLAASRNCEKFVTFDTRLIRRAKGLVKCTVKKP